MVIAEQKCIHDMGCDNSYFKCSPGTYCQINENWSQCLEDFNSTAAPTDTCIGLINGVPNEHQKHGCNAERPCCNSGAVCFTDGHCHLPCGFTRVTNLPIEVINSNIHQEEETPKEMNDSIVCLWEYCVNDATTGPHCEHGSHCVESEKGINYCQENKISSFDGCAVSIDAVTIDEFYTKIVNYECKSSADCCNPDAHCITSTGSSKGTCSLSCSAKYALDHGYSVSFTANYTPTEPASSFYLPIAAVLLGLVVSGFLIYLHQLVQKKSSSTSRRDRRRQIGEDTQNEDKQKEKNVSVNDLMGFEIIVKDHGLR